MDKLGNVQKKVSCVFQTMVVEEPSKKRSYQPYKVVASDQIRAEAEHADISNALASEKLDGTCACILEFIGKPWLWARFDKKPNKMADKKFKKFQNIHRGWQAGGKEGEEPLFEWNIANDFKEVPDYWVPADGVVIKDGEPQPDMNGHIPGWVPIDPTSRQYCWHASTVDLNLGIGLVLQQIDPSDNQLSVAIVDLSELQGHTLELIGTNINGNPYKIGSKQSPIHLLVVHGSIGFAQAPPLDFEKLKVWFEESVEGGVEGIVWHCSNGTLFKAHRHHMSLPWPIGNLKLKKQPVTINVDVVKYEEVLDSDSLFCRLGSVKGHTFPNISSILQKLDDIGDK